MDHFGDQLIYSEGPPEILTHRVGMAHLMLLTFTRFAVLSIAQRREKQALPGTSTGFPPTAKDRAQHLVNHQALWALGLATWCITPFKATVR